MFSAYEEVIELIRDQVSLLKVGIGRRYFFSPGSSPRRQSSARSLVLTPLLPLFLACSTLDTVALPQWEGLGYEEKVMCFFFNRSLNFEGVDLIPVFNWRSCSKDFGIGMPFNSINSA